MKTLQTIIVAGLLAAAVVLVVGCGAFYDCPGQDEAELSEIEVGDYGESSGDSYIRVVSEDLVERVFERDGEVVVETYAVSGREIRKTWEDNWNE